MIFLPPFPIRQQAFLGKFFATDFAFIKTLPVAPAIVTPTYNWQLGAGGVRAKEAMSDELTTKSCQSSKTANGIHGNLPAQAGPRLRILSKCQNERNRNHAVKRVTRKYAAVTLFRIKSEPPELNVIGQQVRKLRQRKGWSQDQFAVKLQLFGWDTSQDSISRLENQTRRVTDLELFVLSDVLAVKFEDFYPPNMKSKVKSLGPHYRAKLSRGQVPPMPKE